MRKYIRFFLTGLGSIFAGVILHELYHYLSLHDIEQVCLVFGDDRIAYVEGYGVSSEIIAYVITITVALVGIGFALYDLFKD